MLTDFGYTLDGLIELTGLLLRDPLLEKYSRARIIEALNDAQADMALEAKLFHEEHNLRLLADVGEYNLADRVEAAGLRPLGYVERVGYYGTDRPALPQLDVRALDRSGYQFDSGSAAYGWTLDLVSFGKLAVDPVPTVDGEALPATDGNIQINYVALPSYLTDGGTIDTAINPTYLRALAYGAASRLLDEGADNDIGLADQYGRDFYNWILRAATDQYRGLTNGDFTA